mgnify:CR=1 FL=1
MTQQILDLFTVKRVTNKVDNFSNYELKFIASAKIEKLKEFNKALYDDFNSKITHSGYEWSLEIEECDYSISQTKFDEIDVENIADDEDLTVSFIVFKKGLEIIIFDDDSFFESIENIELESVLRILNTKFRDGMIFKNDKEIMLGKVDCAFPAISTSEIVCLT